MQHTLQWWESLIRKHIAAAAAAKSLQLCPTLCDPTDGSPPGSPSLGFSRQEHWSGLPFPSPMHESEKWKRSRSVISDSSRPHGLQPTRLLRPWDFPGKSTRVGCHCLLQNTLLAHISISGKCFHALQLIRNSLKSPQSIQLSFLSSNLYTIYDTHTPCKTQLQMNQSHHPSVHTRKYLLKLVKIGTELNAAAQHTWA